MSDRGHVCLGARAGVDHHDAGTRPNIETVGLLEIIEGRVGHEEQGVAEILAADLKAPGAAAKIIIASGFAMFEQHAIAGFTPENESRLED